MLAGVIFLKEPEIPTKNSYGDPAFSLYCQTLETICIDFIGIASSLNNAPTTVQSLRLGEKCV